MERLLQYGADPQARSAMGETPLALFKRIGYAHDAHIGELLGAFCLTMQETGALRPGLTCACMHSAKPAFCRGGDDGVHAAG